MLYRIKNTDAISVFEMAGDGTLTWKMGDMLVIKDGAPRIIDKTILDIFLEPVSAQPSPLDRPFIPDPVKPVGTRKASRGYKRPGSARSAVTNWIIDGRKPIQVMEGRLLVRLFDAVKPGLSPVPVGQFLHTLPLDDHPGMSARVRELVRKGYLESAWIDDLRYVTLTDMAKRAVVKYGDAMRAAQRPVRKNREKQQPVDV